MNGARAELPPPEPQLPADMINPPTIKLLNGGIPASVGISGPAGQLPAGYYDLQGNWVVQQPGLPQPAPSQPAPTQTAPQQEAALVPPDTVVQPHSPAAYNAPALQLPSGEVVQTHSPAAQSAPGVRTTATGSGGPLYTVEQVNAAATKYRMDPELVNTTLRIESNYGADTYNKISPSNTGAFQMASYGAPGGAGDTPENQLNLGIQKLAEEKSDLERRLGRPAQNWEVYLAHQQGAAGAAALINHPDTPAGQVISNVTNGREGGRNISNNGGNPNAPASEFVQIWRDKYTGLSGTSFTAGSTDTYQNWQRALDREKAGLEEDFRLKLADYNKADPGSAARQRLLTSMWETQEQLRQRYLEMEQHPPTEKPVDLISNFGSLATVIGIVGGLFARRPVVASLNAAGAAMEAINTNNHEQYTQAFNTWKTQTDMLSKGLEIEHQMYSEVLDNERLSDAEKVRRGTELAHLLQDKEAIRAFESGNYEKAWKLPLEREKLQVELDNQRAQADEHHAKAEKDRAEAQQRTQWGELAGNDEVSRAARNYVEQEAQRLKAEAKPDDPPPPTVEQLAKDHKVVGEALRAAHDLQRQEHAGSLEQQLLAQKDAERKAAGQKPMNSDERIRALADIRASDRPPTAAQMADEQHASKIAETLDLADQTVAQIESTVMSVGLAGRVLRPGETIGNILHLTNETTRRQIESNIDLLRAEMMRYVTGRAIVTGREATDAQTIIRGLEMGSTPQNTIASIRSMQDHIARANRPVLERHGFLKSETPPSGTPEAAAQRATLPDPTGLQEGTTAEQGGKTVKVIRNGQWADPP